MNISLFYQAFLLTVIAVLSLASDDFPTPPTPGPTPPSVTTEKVVYIGGGRRAEPGFGGYKVKDYSAFKKFKINKEN